MEGGISIENTDIDGLTLRKNITSQNRQFLISVEVPVRNLVIENNLIDGFRGEEDKVKGQNHVQGDAGFVAAGSDFHLKEGSIAVDSASSNGAPDNDYDGNPRPQGEGYDIGA